MNKNKRFIRSIYLPFILFISSCQNSPTSYHFFSNKKNELGMGKKHQFDLHLSIGDKCYYTITDEKQTSFEYDDKKTATGNKTDIGLLYEVVNDSAGNSLLKITYDKLHIILKGQDEDQELDASNATTSDNQVEKLLGNIKGASIYITINKRGDILNVKGSKEISDKILASMQAPDEDIRKKIQEQLSQLVGEAFVKSNLEQGFKLFPDSAIQIGDSWTRKSSQSSDIKFDALTKYTLEC